MGSEAETTGRQAVLAWKVESGNFNGTAIDGLSVVAAIEGNRNLGIFEIGGQHAATKTVVLVDQRASATQRLALVAMARDLAGPIMGNVVDVRPSPINFAETGERIAVDAPQVTLEVSKHMVHDAGCGAQQWFHPLAAVEDPEMGRTEQHAFSGAGLGSRWSDPDKPSAFFGNFSR